MARGQVFVDVSFPSCELNMNNGARLVDYFGANGWSVVDDAKQADIIVVSGCGCAANAETCSLSLLKHYHNVALNAERGARVVAAGCLPFITRQTHGVFSGQSFNDIHSGLACSKPTMHELDTMIGADVPFGTVPYPFSIKQAQVPPPTTVTQELGRHSCMPFYWLNEKRFAMIVPGEGCKNACSYCCTKYAKTSPTSVPAARIIERIRTAVANGAPGVLLYPDDLGSWGYDIGACWTDLLAGINAMPDKFAVGIYNLSASDFLRDNATITQLAESRRLQYLGVMTQHCSPAVLERMRRRLIDAQELSARLIALAQRGVSVLTHVIVGFPGETDDDFQALSKLAHNLAQGGVHLFIFAYTPRAGTHAGERYATEEIATSTVSARCQKLKDVTGRQGTLFHF